MIIGELLFFDTIEPLINNEKRELGLDSLKNKKGVEHSDYEKKEQKQLSLRTKDKPELDY